ncbi:hypothetical protein HDU79_010264 [Rhizoclosmatium sp. JEL0117]|nr:hypothetical protein HDU79_010264 [Rhizoclosmatium sp. JEL0117]
MFPRLAPLLRPLPRTFRPIATPAIASIQRPYLIRNYASAPPPPPNGGNPLNNMDPKLAAAAQKIFLAIQRDTQLTTLCTSLSLKLTAKGIIDPRNPTKQPAISDLMKIAMDREISGLISEVVKRLKELGVLDDEAVRSGMGGQGGLMGALLGGGSGPAPVAASGKDSIEDAEFADVKKDEKKGVLGKVKGLFGKK